MEKSQGIVISVFGNRGYGFMAYNLAFTIKYYNPEIKICLFTEMRTVSHLTEEDLKLFDVVKILDDKNFKKNGIPDVATMKINMLRESPFEETMFIDADTVCVADLSPTLELLNKADGSFFIDVQGRGAKGTEINYDVWAKHEHSYPFFSIPDENNFVSTNSSWFYFKKGKELDEIYGWLRHYAEKNFPIVNLKSRWVKGMLPDELLFSGVISKLNLNVGDFKIIYFGNTYDTPMEIEAKYPLITYYGKIGSGVTLVKPQWLEYLSRKVKQMHKEKGLPYNYRMEFCYQDKALNQ